MILADEPTGNLDAENTANVMKMLGLVRKDFGTTIVLATHDKELAGHATARIFPGDHMTFFMGATIAVAEVLSSLKVQITFIFIPMTMGFFLKRRDHFKA
jgi:ABC-type lipoprotein export system ATPase subunit